MLLLIPPQGGSEQAEAKIEGMPKKIPTAGGGSGKEPEGADVAAKIGTTGEGNHRSHYRSPFSLPPQYPTRCRREGA